MGVQYTCDRCGKPIREPSYFTFKVSACQNPGAEAPSIYDAMARNLARALTTDEIYCKSCISAFEAFFKPLPEVVEAQDVEDT